MASTFHKFSDLPTELRLQIWELALRPLDQRPGAHFFTIFNREQDGDALVESAITGEDYYTHRHMLAAPKCASERTGVSWTKGNPSAYLWDAGMWIACSESREIIEKHYKVAYWKETLKSPDSGIKFCHKQDACVASNFTHNNESWRFAIHPNRDLLCWQPFDHNTVIWKTGNCHIMDDLGIVNNFAGLRGFAHLAIEYDQSWNDIKGGTTTDDLLKEKGPRGLFIRTLEAIADESEPYNPKRIWLIDYSLKQVQKRTSGKHKMAFYASDRAFVEVDEESRQDYRSDREGFSALDFLDKIGGVPNDYFEMDSRCEWCYEELCDHGKLHVKWEVGVLACVKQS